MGWKEKTKSKKPKQRQLFIQLPAEEQTMLDILNERESVHIDETNLCSNLSSSTAAAAILNLELQNIIISLPGKMYRLA